MVNNDQSTLLLLYCCEDVKSHHSGGDTLPLNSQYNFFRIFVTLFLVEIFNIVRYAITQRVTSHCMISVCGSLNPVSIKQQTIGKIRSLKNKELKNCVSSCFLTHPLYLLSLRLVMRLLTNNSNTQYNCGGFYCSQTNYTSLILYKNT